MISERYISIRYWRMT